jgi:predicted peroxiredoxin
MNSSQANTGCNQLDHLRNAEMQEQLVIMCMHGPEEPERATIPFVMATAAQASEVSVIMGLQADAVMLAKKGIGDSVAAKGFPPLKDLLAVYLEMGGTLMVCGPCAQSRKIDPNTDLIEGADVVGAATFVEKIISATNSLVY